MYSVFTVLDPFGRVVETFINLYEACRFLRIWSKTNRGMFELYENHMKLLTIEDGEAYLC